MLSLHFLVLVAEPYRLVTPRKVLSRILRFHLRISNLDLETRYTCAMSQSQDIFEPLTGLTPDQIAGYLREHECLQPRNNTMFSTAQCCPIAQYLRARIPGCDPVVGTSGYYCGGFDDSYRNLRRSLPGNVALFIYLHDRGLYPFLYTN